MNATPSRRSILKGIPTALLALLGRSAFGENAPASQLLNRRVVTGTSERGKSFVLSDGPVPEAARFKAKGKPAGSDVWLVKHVPVDLSEADPITGYSVQSWPPPGGIIARMITWQPGFSYPSHRSATLDFIFIISGQLELVLEEQAVVLRPGDTAIQRGTVHGWRVVGSKPCTFAAVLIAASEKSNDTAAA